MPVTNLYPPFDSSSINWAQWTATGEKVQTQPVYSKSTAWNGLFNAYTDLVGVYTFSIYVKSDKANAKVAIYAHYTGTPLTDISTFDVISVSGENARIRERTETSASAGLYTLTNANQWYRISATIDFHSAEYIGLRGELCDANTTLYESAPMLETGDTLHSFVPYGGWIWHAHEGEYPINDLTAPTLQTSFERPFPASLWRIDEGNDGYPYHDLIPSIVHYVPHEVGGAFEDAASLASVRVPMSVKTIGPKAFKGTALQRIRIAADCTYGEQSFPEGCVATRYPDDRYEQLYDSAGRAVLDYDARRIYVLKEEPTNG